MNDILDKSYFVSDQREIVLESIKVLDPHFQPNYTPPVLTYTNGLVDSLNANVEPAVNDAATVIPQRSRNRGITIENLKDFSREQLNMEMKGEIVIKSIEKFPEENHVVLHYVS